MSFLKITDPTKREASVKEFLELKNRIKDNFRSERIGEIETQSDLSKFFKPITETQKATAKEITEQLKPIREGIKELPQAITFPTFPSIKASTVPTEKEDVQYVDNLAREYLMSFATKGDLTDKKFGIYSVDKKFYIGDKNVKIDGNDIIVLDNVGNVFKTYKGTPGLWELLVIKKPNENIIMRSDLDNYENLLHKTNSLYKDNDPNQNRPKGNYRGDEWNKVKKFWNNRNRYEGSGIVIIPEDPNALLERLDLLLASQDAGHTGVGNELVSICDELKIQGVINADTYIKLNSYIKI